MPSRILRTQSEVGQWVSFLCLQPLPMTVSHTKGAKRSLAQNATLHMWFGQIAKHMGDTAAGVKAQCKLHHGLPIMQRDQPDWVDEWSPLYGPLPYEMRLKLFEALPMTSVMTTKQLSEFMEAVQHTYRPQGVRLIDPEARKYEGEFGK